MRNKKIADLSIVVLLLLVIIIALIQMNFRNNEIIKMLSFVIEAALVGAIADWFAITALFEKPFLVGKIPIIASHTAIISKNREIIVNSVADVVQNKLLSEKVLKGKIEEINIVDGLIGFIDKNINTRSELYETLIDYIIEKINTVDSLVLAKLLETHLKQKIEEIDISVYLDKKIEYGIDNYKFKEIFNILLDTISIYVNDKERKDILEKFANDFLKKEANSLVMEKIISILKSVNAINTSDVVKSILEQINKILLNLKNENDNLRCETIQKIEQLFKKVHRDNNIRSDIEKWKITMIKEISVQDELNTIIKDVINVITEKETFLCNNTSEKNYKNQIDLLLKEDIVSVVTCIKIQLENQWIRLKNDDVNKEIMNKYIKEAIFKFIESKYKNVGHTVKQVLNSMDDESLNNFIKKKAGNELHGIRINGCTVGALFGGVVFALTHIIYDLILPNILSFRF
ncbi:DUF445 domain-containing protein [Clostridium algoriphilum]|uniref:DUF445 domain-containing protein n=1 Tax=Clostridium algoriphilum TaxID=198347 RepID=UPI001CF47D5B|nr:DUF445 domain-containing protein [Clostridium algoriphilum]MCB2292499.1 DUF445 domain-containing protein [Clostridium algoriphilum]